MRLSSVQSVVSRLLLLFATVAISLVSLASPEDEPDGILDAEELYVWGYPLVQNLRALRGLAAGELPMFGPVGINEFAHARRLMAPEDRFVSPNVDVLFSAAIIDLANGPVDIDLPDTRGRYYVLQFLDPWTNSFAYLGKRSSGTSAGAYRLVFPGAVDSEHTDTEDGRTVIFSPASLALLVLRISIADVEGLAELHVLQDGFQLSPLIDSHRSLDDLLGPHSNDELAFWRQLHHGLIHYPGPPYDEPWLSRAAGLNLGFDKTGQWSADVAAVLLAGQKVAEEQLEKLAVQRSTSSSRGWESIVHLFDFNRHLFGTGVVNSPEWVIEDVEQAYRRRMLAARVGLWGNHGYEAAFFQAWRDKDGQPLSGSSRYRVVLNPPMPAKAFWSVTNYTVPDFFLYENPEEIYGIASYDESQKKQAGESVTIIFSHDKPAEQCGGLWIPTPPGRFRPLLSLYHPDIEVLTDGWWPSSLEKLDPQSCEVNRSMIRQ